MGSIYAFVHVVWLSCSFLEHDVASLGELFLPFSGNIVPCEFKSVEQFMNNCIPVRPLDTWKQKHCVISEHRNHSLTDTTPPSQKTRIV